jgi:membrane-anchored mycosin MYCP
VIAAARRTTALLAAAGVLAAFVSVGGLAAAPRAHADEIRAKQWYLSAMGIEKAWSISKGAGVKIGIVDSGVDGSAADLNGAVVGGQDFSGAGAANGQKPVNGDPHGTEVASLAIARGHGDAAGVIGAAPAASLVTASVDDNATGDTSFGSAVQWLVDQGVSVINMSLFTTSDASVQALHSAVNYAESKDVVVVAATGDLFQGQTDLEAPASFPGVVAVTGVDEDLKRDPSATIGSGTAIAGPFSTTAVHPFSNASYVGLPVVKPGGGYASSAGTSLAAPVVAGVAALIRAKYPDLDAANVINRLLRSATPAGGKTPNDTYGYGILNAHKALSANIAKVSANPLGGVAPSTSSSTAASSAPHTGNHSGAHTGSGHSSAPAQQHSSAAAAGSESSTGLGAGAWIGIAAAVIVVLALIGWLIARSRRSNSPPDHAPGPPGPPRSPTRGPPPGPPPTGSHRAR